MSVKIILTLFFFTISSFLQGADEESSFSRALKTPGSLCHTLFAQGIIERIAEIQDQEKRYRAYLAFLKEGGAETSEAKISWIIAFVHHLYGHRVPLKDLLQETEVRLQVTEEEFIKIKSKVLHGSNVGSTFLQYASFFGLTKNQVRDFVIYGGWIDLIPPGMNWTPQEVLQLLGKFNDRSTDNYASAYVNFVSQTLKGEENEIYRYQAALLSQKANQDFAASVERYELSPAHLADLAKREQSLRPQAYANHVAKFSTNKEEISAQKKLLLKDLLHKVQTGEVSRGDIISTLKQIQPTDQELKIAFDQLMERGDKASEAVEFLRFENAELMNACVKKLYTKVLSTFVPSWSDNPPSLKAYEQYIRALVANSDIVHHNNFGADIWRPMPKAFPKEEERFEILRKVYPWIRADLGYSLTLFAIENKALRAKFLDEYKTSDSIWRALDKIPIDPIDYQKIVTGAAKHHPEAAVARLETLPLKDEQKLLVMSQALKTTEGLAQLLDPAHRHHLQGPLEEQIFALIQENLSAKTFTKSELRDAHKRLLDAVSDHSKRVILAKALLQKNNDPEAYENLVLPLGELNNPDLLQISFVHNPLVYLERAGYEVSENTPVDAPTGASLVSFFKDYSKKNPKVLTAAESELLWPDSLGFKSRTVGLETLRLLYHMKDQKIVSTTEVTSPYEAFAHFLGFKGETLQKLSPNRRRELLELALLLQREIGEPLFQLKELDQGVLEAEGFAHILSLGKVIVQMEGSPLTTWKMLKSDVFQGLLTKEKLATVTGLLKEKVVQSVKAIFGGTEVKIAAEDVTKLAEDWGDLEPVAALIGNYRSRRLEKSVEFFASVFEQILQGKFHDLKYKGHPKNPQDQEKAKAQLASLTTEQQLAGWTKKRSKVSLGGSSKGSGGSPASNQEEALKIVRNHIDQTLKRNFNPNPERNLQEKAQDALTVILVGRGNPKDIYESIKKDSFATQTHVQTLEALLGSAIEKMAESTSPKEISDLAKFFVGLSAVLKEHKLRPEAGLQQLKEDLQSVSAQLTPSGGSTLGGETLVVSVLVNDPWSMITIGNRVKGVSSCQNYRTGSHVYTLMGYVVDANVQATLSFSLKRGRELSPKEFDQIKEQINAGKTVEATWVPGAQKLKFTFAEEEILSKPTETAKLRHILKLGDVKKEEQTLPGYAFEPAYELSDPDKPTMDQQVQQIRDDIVADTGGVKGEEISIPLTRNLPNSGGGVYSDAGGGAKTEPYIMREKLRK